MPTDLQQTIHRLAATIHDHRTDAGLIAAFLRDVDQDAFTELVRRHGSMVFGVCRRLLGQTPDAEDAFQATFLVLIRRARQTAWRNSLGPWLYGVALRVARKARARRFTSPTQASEMAIEPTVSVPTPDDSADVLDEELAALPETYRRPLLLCELQGLSRKEAAHELGLPEGTLSSRLGRGRRMLRERLARRGVSPAIAGLAAMVPAKLASATVQNAVAILTRATGTVPAGIVFLMEGVVKTMIVKWKFAVVLIAACIGLTGYGAWQGSTVPAMAAAADPPHIQPTPPVDQQPGKPVPYPTPYPSPGVVQRPKPSDAVATIFGDETITREAFANHLIERYGKKELEQFVTRTILSRAFGKRG
ncbi:MAG TPA: sigma-70 family RNA polymerase sigma factor, partial [Gemmata sp.]|nr:sigma-70 family RNA polymerase sigma factor [Gemmata sp.]